MPLDWSLWGNHARWLPQGTPFTPKVSSPTNCFSVSLTHSDRLNLSNTGLGDGNACLLFKAWNSPGEGVDHDQFENLDDDDEVIDDDVFRDEGDTPFSLISLRLANNKLEQFAAKELSKFLRSLGSCLAEVRLDSETLSSIFFTSHSFTQVGHFMERAQSSRCSASLANSL
jgi:hypothetical protein